jgi:hypothetical protein
MLRVAYTTTHSCAAACGTCSWQVWGSVLTGMYIAAMPPTTTATLPLPSICWPVAIQLAAAPAYGAPILLTCMYISAMPPTTTATLPLPSIF